MVCLKSACVIVAALAGVITSAARLDASESGPSKFGSEWPPLNECLEFSEETGQWGSGAINYRFDADGSFTITYSNPYRNRFQRLQRRKITFEGTWKLVRRTFSASEKARLKIPASNRFRGYFLELAFTKNTADPPFEEGTDFSVLFPAREGGTLNHRAVFLLDEQHEYPVPVRGRRSASIKTKSNPRHLHWIVIFDDLEFFPKGTEPGKTAWTLVHR